MENQEITIKRLEEASDSQQAYCCMTEVPSPWPQALCQCRDWVTENLGRYVEGYHLQLPSGDVVGHLYFAYSDNALFPYKVEPGVGILYCDWVQKRYQGRGLGKRLFAAFVEDLHKEDIKGILVEATDLKGQMHFHQYQARGFEILYERGHHKLLYLPLTEKEIQANPLPGRIEPRQGTPVEILILNGYMCPYEVSTLFLLRAVALEFGDRVVLRDVWLTPETLHEFGVAKGVFINGQQKLSGAETEESIRQAIIEEF